MSATLRRCVKCETRFAFYKSRKVTEKRHLTRHLFFVLQTVGAKVALQARSASRCPINRFGPFLLVKMACRVFMPIDMKHDV